MMRHLVVERVLLDGCDAGGM
jgi:hypothetical protein